MRLAETILCCNCEEVFKHEGVQSKYGVNCTCPRCASQHTMPLARWLKPLGEEYYNENFGVRQTDSRPH